MTTIKQVNINEMKYGTIKKVAKFLNIETDGLSLQQLADKVNEEITSRGGEIEIDFDAEIATQHTNNEDQVDEQTEEQDQVDTPEDKTNAQQEDSEEKWYSKGYGNVPGDKVTIIGKNIHQSTPNSKVILQGRTAVVIGPSRMEDTIQVHLLDNEGKQQKSIVTLKKGEYANYGEVAVEVPKRKPRAKKEDTQNPVEQNNEQQNFNQQQDLQVS